LNPFAYYSNFSCPLINNVLVTANTLDAAFTQLHDLRAVFKSCEAVGDDEQGEVFAESFNGCMTACSVSFDDIQ
jgi:hypothetical protein